MLFRFFNEVGIIAQLSRAMLESHLPTGYTAAQFAVLNHLVRLGDGRTPLQLASAFQTPKTSMTHMLAGLERGGLIEMRANPQDGRSKLVFLTPAGLAFREHAIQALTPDLEALAQRVPSLALHDALPLLEQVRQVMDANRPASRRP